MSRIPLNAPDAEKRLRGRLGLLIREYERMRMAREIRKHPVWSDKRKLKKLSEIGANPAETVLAEGYSHQELRRLNAKIGQTRKRLEQLEAARTSKAVETEVVAGVLYFEDPATIRCGFIFESPAAAEVYRYLKRSGFRYAPTRDRWQRMLNDRGLEAARAAAEKFRKGMKYAED